MDLVSAEQELNKRYATREKWMPLSRSIVAECAKAIREVHVQKKTKRLTKIKTDIKKLEKIVSKDSRLTSLLSTPYQEWVELEVLLCFVGNKPLPKLIVPPEYYVLGVLDAIGEGKRLSLELLLKSKNKDALKMYQRLEETYYSMEGYSFPKSIVPGLKSKQDAMKRSLEGLYQIIVQAGVK